jgi:hypothetical protein
MTRRDWSLKRFPSLVVVVVKESGGHQGRQAANAQPRRKQDHVGVSCGEILARRKQKGTAHCGALSLHWSGSPSIHGALP